MLVFIVRLLFFLAMVAVGYAFGGAFGEGWNLSAMLVFGLTALVAIGLDAAFRRKNISVVSAVFFGLLVGLLVSVLLGPVVDMYELQLGPKVCQALKVGIATVTSYLAISIVLQTKDDFRFIIPYIEFAKQRKGGRPLLLDTSVIIDGRIADIAETGFLDSPMIVPRFILYELQGIADSSEKMRRDRGRRGLDILNRLQTTPNVDIRIQDTRDEAAGDSVDQRLVNLAAELNGRVVTVDYNLNKVARLAHVEVLNINDLANALKSTVIPGEKLEVTILKPGQEDGQGVGYLDDGTMVVVEDGQNRIGQSTTITVTNVLQKSAGRIIFGSIEGKSRQRS